MADTFENNNFDIEQEGVLSVFKRPEPIRFLTMMGVLLFALALNPDDLEKVDNTGPLDEAVSFYVEISTP